MRVGVIVAKHRHTIVERNRLRRRLRELVRVRLIPQSSAMDVVIRSLPAAYDATMAVLTIEIEEIRRKLNNWLEEK